MRAFFYRLLIEGWPKRLVALVLAGALWMIVNHSMISHKTISNIPVRVVHLPPEKTVETMQTNGILNKKISLTLTGNQDALEELSAKDLEIVIDAEGKPDQWVETLSKKHLVSLNPDIDLAKHISRVSPKDLSIKQSRLIAEKIPVLISQPTGEAPKGYQYLGIRPYQCTVTVKGPEETIKWLKAHRQKLTFNLSNIAKAELDALSTSQDEELIYFIPDSWKKISFPQLSDSLVEIDDLQANNLRIAFSRQDLIPIEVPIPVVLFYPLRHSAALNPETYTLEASNFLVKKNDAFFINAPLYAQGVSQQFLDIVEEMMQIVIVAAPKSERDVLLWSAQIIYPHELEDRYVAKVLSEAQDEAEAIQPHAREEYLRNRFRNYMSLFRFYTADKKKLSLRIELQPPHAITVTPQY